MLPTALEAVAESVADLAAADSSFALAAQQHTKDSTRQPALWSMRLKPPSCTGSQQGSAAVPRSEQASASFEHKQQAADAARHAASHAPQESAFATPETTVPLGVMLRRRSSDAPQSGGLQPSAHTVQAHSSAFSRRATLNANEAPDSFCVRSQEPPELRRSVRPATLREVLAQCEQSTESSTASARGAAPPALAPHPRLAHPLHAVTCGPQPQAVVHTAPAAHLASAPRKGAAAASPPLQRAASGSCSPMCSRSKAGTPASDLPAHLPSGISSELLNESSQRHLCRRSRTRPPKDRGAELAGVQHGRRHAGGYGDSASTQITPAACSDAVHGGSSRGRNCHSGVVAKVPVAAKQAKTGLSMTTRLKQAKQRWLSKRGD